MTKENIIAFVSGLALLVAALAYGHSGNLFGASGIGPNHYQAENFLQGLYAGTSGQASFNNAGLLTVIGVSNSSSSWIGGTTQNNQVLKFGSASSTVSTGFLLGPLGSVTSTATTTVAVSIAGLSVTDPCISSVVSSTNPIYSDCFISAAAAANATATITIVNGLGTATTTPTSSQVRVDVWHLPY